MLQAFFESFWAVYGASAPFLLLGFAVAGAMHQFLPADFIQKHLGGHGWQRIFKAAVVGTPVPLCSCGVVPVGLSLHEKGLSKGATTAFLIATPENGVDSLSLSYSLFGGIFTLVRLLCSLFVAVTTGLLVHGWVGVGAQVAPPEPVKSCCAKQAASKQNGFHYVVYDFLPKTAHWLLLGFGLSALLMALLPEGALSAMPQAWHLLAAALVGIPLYVCAAASTPIALGFLLAGLTPGACLVFLLTGPATNAANIPLYVRQLGLKTTLGFYLGLFVTSIACGWFVDLWFDAKMLGIDMLQAGHSHGEEMSVLEWGAILVFTGFFLHALWLRLRRS